MKILLVRFVDIFVYFFFFNDNRQFQLLFKCLKLGTLCIVIVYLVIIEKTENSRILKSYAPTP